MNMFVASSCVITPDGGLFREALLPVHVPHIVMLQKIPSLQTWAIRCLERLLVSVITSDAWALWVSIGFHGRCAGCCGFHLGKSFSCQVLGRGMYLGYPDPYYLLLCIELLSKDLPSKIEMWREEKDAKNLIACFSWIEAGKAMIYAFPLVRLDRWRLHTLCRIRRTAVTPICPKGSFWLLMPNSDLVLANTGYPTAASVQICSVILNDS